MTARDTTTETDPTDEVGAVDAAPTPAVDPAVDLTKADGAATAADVTGADAADGAGDAAADDAAGSPTRARRRRRREAPHRGGAAATAPRRRWPLVALLVVAALFAGATAAVYVATRPDPIAGLSAPQQAAVDAASQAAVNLQTFRRASFDKDFANALASLTPEFAQQQLAPRKDALQKQLTGGGRDATATALSAGLVSSTASQAVVLVVTTTTQTADNGQSTPFVFSRLQLTLQLTGGKWLVSDLQSVGLS